MILKPKNREAWLKLRHVVGIGGSEAGCVIGMNKYQSNVDLWELKTGLREAIDLSDNEAVRFGKYAEEHIRALFVQDYPEFDVDYHEFWMYQNDKFPFIFATLDGELTEKSTGKRGILEIKTTTIRNKSQWDDWDDKIPDSYYAQLLHQLAATGWDFAILTAYIRYYKDGELRIAIRHYNIKREDVEQDIAYLIEAETEFMNKVKNRIRPNLILPKI